MSTVNRNKKNSSQGRFVKLAQTGELIFNVDDLARIWLIKNKNNLHTTLKRYNKAGLLKRVFRGVYSLGRVAEIDPMVLGIKIIHDYCYVSGETVLAQSGLIQQKINYISLVGAKSRRFKVGQNNYYCRQLKNIFLFNDAGLENKKGIKVASPARAVADLLYFNPDFYFDNQTAINWAQVRKVQKVVGYIK